MTLRYGIFVLTLFFSAISFGSTDEKRSSREGFRVLLLGPRLASGNLDTRQTLERSLEKHLRDRGFKSVEVISGSMPGYHAPRAAVEIRRLSATYRPTVVVYFQTGSDFIGDYLEWADMDFNHLGYPHAYRSPDYGNWVPDVVGKFSPRFANALEKSLRRTRSLLLFWRLYGMERFNADVQRALLQPGVTSLKLVHDRGNIDVDFFVLWMPGPVRVFGGRPDIDVARLGWLRYLAPGFNVSSSNAVRAMTEGGLEVVSLSDPDGNFAKDKIFRGGLSATETDIWAVNIATMLHERYRNSPYFEGTRRREIRQPSKSQRPKKIFKRRIKRKKNLDSDASVRACFFCVSGLA